MKKFLKSLLAVLMSALIIFSASITAFASENNYKYGVDISYHNGEFDFSSSAFEGKSFVMIRLGYYNHIDTEFWNNVKKATAANIDFGVYLYSYAYSSAEVKVESDFAIKTLSQLTDEQRQHFTLPLAYDLEDKKLAENLGYSKSKITAQAVQFCDAVKNVGYVPMIYANQNWFTKYIDLNTVVSKKYKIWFAYYTSNPDFSKPKTIGTTGVAADIWQYAEKSADIISRSILRAIIPAQKHFIMTLCRNQPPSAKLRQAKSPLKSLGKSKPHKQQAIKFSIRHTAISKKPNLFGQKAMSPQNRLQSSLQRKIIMSA